MRRQRAISAMLIIASLSGLLGIMYPTTHITRTFDYTTTYPADTEFATSLRTATGTVEFDAQFQVLNGLTIYTPESGIMTAICGVTYQSGYDKYGNPTITSVPVLDCTKTVIITVTSIDSTLIPAQTGMTMVSESGVAGYVAAGEPGTIALFIIIMTFFVGMTLFVKSRKSVFTKS